MGDFEEKASSATEEQHLGTQGREASASCRACGAELGQGREPHERLPGPACLHHAGLFMLSGNRARVSALPRQIVPCPFTSLLPEGRGNDCEWAGNLWISSLPLW